MADAIRQEFDLPAELIPGGGGIFDVSADGEMLFSKHEVGRFPENEEVLTSIAARLR